jgi:4-amino-4-deoxy-L-arabinose transferase-like glycosyltransferase
MTRSMLERLTTRRAYGLLLLCLLLLRLPGMIFGVVDLDEIEFLLIGRSLREGWLPYVDLVETKPLLAYLFYAPTALFGFAMWPIQLLAVLWSFATAVTVGRAARLWTDSAETGAVAAWLCGLAGTCNVLSVNAELMLNLPVAGALLCFVRAERRDRRLDDLLSGLCVGLAALFKHQAGIVLLALAVGALWSEWRARRSLGIARLVALGIGFSVPWGLAAGFYAAAGHWEAFFEWNVVRNFLYVGHSAGSALGRFALSLLLCVLLGAPVLWTFAVRASLDRDGDSVRRGVALALWLTWIPVSLGGRFYEHYFIQFVPPLALLAAPDATRALRGWRKLGRGARTAFALGLLLPVAGFAIFGVTRGLVHGYIGQDPKVLELGRWLRANTPPEAKVFIWGHAAPIFYVARRLPGTRYKNAVFQTGDFDPQHIAPGFDLRPYLSRRDLDNTLDDFARRRPEVVVDTAPCDIHGWSKVPLSLFPELQRLLAERYRLVASPAGCPVYLRR